MMLTNRRARVLRRLLTVLGLAACVSMPAAAQADNAELRSLLAPGTLTVETLATWSPPRLIELTAKVQRAAAADPAWFRAAVAAAPPGTPMSYDARLGVSREEYRELLALADSIGVRPSGAATIGVESTPTGWRFTDATTIPALRSLEIDTVASVVRAPAGELILGTPIVASDAQKATGPWRATRWQRSVSDATAGDGATMTLAIGRFTASRRGVIYLQGRTVRGGALVERADVLVRLAP